VCEEAHRYASVDKTIGFGPTRRAISRIAKEGRKCGVFLALATQRAAELDPTIISQCSTLFAMRMSNDRDQSLLRSAVADTAANLFGFVPSLGTREALAFGVGVPLPTRLTFSELPPRLIPRCEAFANEQAVQTSGHDLNFIVAVLERWRGSMARSNNPDDAARDARPGVRPDAVPLQPEPNRFSLLKKPLASLSDPFSALRGPR
jgi:DNA helicase HerA-like ATPase